jgi:hypothetical protein
MSASLASERDLKKLLRVVSRERKASRQKQLRRLLGQCNNALTRRVIGSQ